MTSRYDYIIVGAGTTGGVIAKILSDLTTASILVLDMGMDHIDDPVVQRADQVLIADSETGIVKDYITTRDTSLDNRRFDINQGVGWGGSTSSNNMLTSKPSGSYLNYIQKLGIPQAAIEAGYRDVEKYIPMDSALRGINGPMTVTQLPLGSSPYNMMTADIINESTPTIDSSISIQYSAPLVNDYNLGSQETFVSERYQVFAEREGISNSTYYRQEVGKQYLSTIFHPNGTSKPIIRGGTCEKRKAAIIDRAKVTKILFKRLKKKCGDPCKSGGLKYKPDAVEVWVDDKCCTFYAKCGVILATGAIETPALLQRSGIGPCSVLEPLGIDVVIPNEIVGSCLMMHTGFRMEYFLSSNGGSAMEEAELSLISYIKRNITLNYPFDTTRNIEILGYSSGQKIDDLYGTIIEVSLVTPVTTGTVNIVSNNAFTDPIISYTSLNSEVSNLFISLYRELYTIVENYVIDYNVTHSPPLVITWPFGYPSSDDLLLNIIQQNSFKRNLSSTARMGPFGLSVVDNCFQVYGTKGLYIVDSSVLPVVTDSQPELFLMSMASYFVGLLINKCNRRPCLSVDMETQSRIRKVICDKCTKNPCCCRSNCNVVPYVKYDSCFSCSKKSCKYCKSTPCSCSSSIPSLSGSYISFN